MANELHQRMSKEMSDKTLFDSAQKFAYDYADNSRDRNVFPTAQALEALKEFDESMPELMGGGEEVMEMLHRLGSPATVSQIAGRYYGLVNGGVIPAALAAKWLVDFWDQNCPLFLSSPIASKLEEVVESWLKDLLGLPARCVAGFVSGSSMAIFCGLAAGRYRLFENQGWDINKKGYQDAPKIRIIASRQAHGTVTKAVALLGFGSDNVEWVDADEQGRIDEAKIPELCSSTLLILQAANVNSGAFDNFELICAKARQAGSWVHVDGAFGLWAAGSEKLKYLTQGAELANSWSLDAHKTLNAPYDSGIVMCDDKDALINALQASGSYIVYGENRDGMLYTPEMSRRARSVELWATLKYLGKMGVDELVTGLHFRAQQAANELQAVGFQILNDVCFNQILIAADDEEQTLKVMESVQNEGVCWVGGSKWKDKSVIRFSVCSWATTAEDISMSVRSFDNARRQILGNK